MRKMSVQESGRTCLCFGFLEQIIYILPFLLTTLQPSHMTLTDARTFMPRASTTFGEGAAWSAWWGWWW